MLATPRRHPRPSEGRGVALPESEPGQPIAAGTTLPQIPVLPAIIARPVLIGVSAVVGGVLGLLLAGSGGYQATTVLQVGTAGSDSGRVEQIAQTIQRLVTTSAVLDRGAAELGVPARALQGQVAAEWQEDTDLVIVRFTGETAEAAVEGANAVAQATVDANRAAIGRQLVELRADADALLTRETLSDSDAEAARRRELGAALASRQDAVSAGTSGVFLADPAARAHPAGLDRVTGTVAGELGGGLLGAMLAVGLGWRGVRARRVHRVSSFLPGVTAGTVALAADVAGRAVQEDLPCVVVVALPGTQQDSRSVAEAVARLVRGHGKQVEVVDLINSDPAEQRRSVLSHETRASVRQVYGADVAVAVVMADDHQLAMIAGQSGFELVLVVQASTRLSAVAALVARFDRVRPAVVLVS